MHPSFYSHALLSVSGILCAYNNNNIHIALTCFTSENSCIFYFGHYILHNFNAYFDFMWLTHGM